MDSPGHVSTSDNEEAESLQSHRVEYWEAAAARIKDGFASLKAVRDSLKSAQDTEHRRSLEQVSSREGHSPPRKRLKAAAVEDDEINGANQDVGSVLRTIPVNDHDHDAEARTFGDEHHQAECRRPDFTSPSTPKSGVENASLLPFTTPKKLPYVLLPSHTATKRKVSRLYDASPSKQRDEAHDLPILQAAPRVAPATDSTPQSEPFSQSSRGGAREFSPIFARPPPELLAIQGLDSLTPRHSPSGQSMLDFSMQDGSPHSVPDVQMNSPALNDLPLTRKGTSPPLPPDPLLLFTPSRQTVFSDPAIPSVTQRSPQALTPSAQSRSAPELPLSPLTPVFSPGEASQRQTQAQNGENQELLFRLAQEEQGHEGVRYSFRTRQARQLKPYEYDKRLYRQQLRANPEAIVTVLSPGRRRRTERGGGQSSESEESEARPENGVSQEVDEEEERFWRRHERRRNAAEGSTIVGPGKNANHRSPQKEQTRARGQEKQGNAQDRALASGSNQVELNTDALQQTRDNLLPSFFYDTFSSDGSIDEDLLPLARISGTSAGKEKEKLHKTRLRRFPIKEKDLKELAAHDQEEISASDLPGTRVAVSDKSPGRDNNKGRIRSSSPQEDVISIGDDRPPSRDPTPPPIFDWDFGSPISPLAPPDLHGMPSELEVPPTSSVPPTSGSASDRPNDLVLEVTSGSDSDDSRDSRSSSNSSSSVLEMTEAQLRRMKEDKRRERALRRMGPAVWRNKILNAAKHTATNQKAMTTRHTHSDESDEDRPLLPGQTRVRVGLNRTNSDIKGDPESSDLDVPEEGRAGEPDNTGDAGEAWAPYGSPPPIAVSERFMSGSDRESHSGVDLQLGRTHKQPVDVISISSSSSEDEGANGSEDMAEVIEQWVSKPTGRQRSSNRVDNIREGDLIDWMLSRTRTSGFKKKSKRTNRQKRLDHAPSRHHHSSNRGGGGASSGAIRGTSGGGGGSKNPKILDVVTDGARRHGVERQTRLPFHRQQSISSRASGSTHHAMEAHGNTANLAQEYTRDPTSPNEQQIQDSHAVSKSMTRNERKRAANAQGLYTFSSTGKHITSGRTHPTAVTMETEQEEVQRSILEFARRDEHGRRQPPHSRSTARRNSSPAKRRAVPAPPTPKDVLAHDLPSTFDLGKTTLPSGLVFGTNTYLGNGWLQDFLATQSDQNATATVGIPHPLALLEFFIPSPPTIAVFVELMDSICTKLFSLVGPDLPGPSPGELHHWRRLLHCVCQHVTSLLGTYVGGSGDIDPLLVCIVNQLRQASALAEKGFAVRADDSRINFLMFEVQWFAVELSCRAQTDPRTSSVPAADVARPSHHITKLLRHLWAYGLNRVKNSISSRDPEGFDYSNPSQRLAEMWICLIYLLQEGNRLITSPSLTFWQVLLQVVKESGAMGAPTDPQASEMTWVGLFGLMALSQFTNRGVSTSSFRLPACWQLVADALGRVRLDPTTEQNVSPPALKKRDKYVRLLFARCLTLRETWNWRLVGGPAIFSLFNRLYAIFRERQFANLPTEASDFPSFLRHHNLRLLSQVTSSDTAFATFLKMIVQTASDTDPTQRRATVSKILSLAIPIGSLKFTKESPPRTQELSKLYNRFCAVTVAIYLDPSQAYVDQCLSLARQYINFGEADGATRIACIRGHMHLSLILKNLALPLKKQLDWLAEMTDVLVDEYIQMSKPSASVTPAAKNLCQIHVQMVLRTVARIIGMDMDKPDGQGTSEHKYPDPELLQGPWVTRVFSAGTDLTTVPTTGDAMRLLIQAFLDARQMVVPPPRRRPRITVQEEDSQEDYGQADSYFNDPEVLAALGEVDTNTELSSMEDAVCKSMDQHIVPTVYRLVCKQFIDTPTDHASFDGWWARSDKWIDCWVGCASVLVQNRKREWLFFLDFGPQSWERIPDASWRRRVGLQFMYRLLKQDPTAYSAFQDRFLGVLFQSLVTAQPTVEPQYAALLFSIDDLRHPILLYLPVAREDRNTDFEITKATFLDCRMSWIDHMCNRIGESLDAPVWDVKLNNQAQTWVSFVNFMLLTMKSILEGVGPDTQEYQQYKQFYLQVRSSLSRVPKVHDHPCLNNSIQWLDSLV